MNVYIIQLWALALAAFAIGSLVAWFGAQFTFKPVDQVRDELSTPPGRVRNPHSKG